MKFRKWWRNETRGMSADDWFTLLVVGLAFAALPFIFTAWGL